MYETAWNMINIPLEKEKSIIAEIVETKMSDTFEYYRKTRKEYNALSQKEIEEVVSTYENRFFLLRFLDSMSIFPNEKKIEYEIAKEVLEKRGMKTNRRNLLYYL